MLINMSDTALRKLKVSNMLKNILLVICMMILYLLWQGIQIVEMEKERLIEEYKIEVINNDK